MCTRTSKPGVLLCLFIAPSYVCVQIRDVNKTLACPSDI